VVQWLQEKGIAAFVPKYRFSAGGHGFGTIKKGTSSDHWIDAFY
jgi:hypothetical protein